MTIEDKTKNEKLKYDIKREAAKISALSAVKIDKYEYLTDEEILPSYQRQIIEEAKFTYCPSEKAFEKQTKIIEDQGEKQIKAIEDKDFSKSIEKTKNYSEYDYKKELLLSKERKMFRDFYNDRLDQIERANYDVDYNNLKYTVISSGEEFEFDKSEDPLVFLKEIKESKISIQEAKNIQKEYNKYLNSTRKGNKTRRQRETLNNMNILFNA